MKFYLYIFFLVIVLQAQAQVIAPNFTATDINGNTYNLYEELDMGKPVILDFFAYSCVTCQNNTPHIDSIWQEHGYDGDSLWVWGIECFHYPPEQVEEFQLTYGATFPAFSTELDDTLVSMFDVTYTPQYVVICPDHSMKKIAVDHVEPMVLACPSPTSSQLLELKPGFKVVLNAERLSIQHTYENKEDLELTVFDVTGQKLFQGIYAPEEQIDIPWSYKKQLLIVRLIIDGEIITQKVY